MLLILALVLALLWIGGLALSIAGGLIHILLVLAVIVIVLHFVNGRRSQSL
ncbi:MAG TPA: lmo0937 family membrane protein [Chloroflexota bacterium]|nr:lmo0937 family membrane protein [Chloroflexota bacterium]